MPFRRPWDRGAGDHGGIGSPDDPEGGSFGAYVPVAEGAAHLLEVEVDFRNHAVERLHGDAILSVGLLALIERLMAHQRPLDVAGHQIFHQRMVKCRPERMEVETAPVDLVRLAVFGEFFSPKLCESFLVLAALEIREEAGLACSATQLDEFDQTEPHEFGMDRYQPVSSVRLDAVPGLIVQPVVMNPAGRFEILG